MSKNHNPSDPLPFFLLIVLALIFTVLSMAFPRFPLLAVAVLLICVALMMART